MGKGKLPLFCGNVEWVITIYAYVHVILYIVNCGKFPMKLINYSVCASAIDMT